MPLPLDLLSETDSSQFREFRERLRRQLRNEKFVMTARVYRHARLAPEWQLPGLLRANAHFVCRYYARFSTLHLGFQRRRLVASVEGSGASTLARAGCDRGVLLASVHLGEFDIAGAWLAHELGREVVVITDRLTPRTRQAFFDGARTKSGLVLRRRALTRLHDVEGDLARGRVVLWMFDRAEPGPTIATSLLGRPARLPVAPIIVSRRTGAALICGTTCTDSSNILHVHTTEPMELDDRPASAVLAQLTEQLGAAIRRCPWQWHVPADANQLPFIESCSTTRPASRAHGTWAPDTALEQYRAFR